jgi:NlpC/P60 family protein
MAIAAVVIVAAPLPGLRASDAPLGDERGPVERARVRPTDLQDPDRPRVERFTAAEAGVTIVPPAGWVMSPVTALNPQSDPPEPVQEVARFQVRVGDAQLYAAPIPITSGLVADAVAVISIGVAREGSDILEMDRGVRGTREVSSVPGFTMLEDEATYEGLHVLTRYLFSRENDRVIVVRAAAAETAWTGFTDQFRAALASFGGDPAGANAPAPAPPSPPPAQPVEPAPDPTVLVRHAILARAASLLGLRYVWGGNSTVNGMDCSAFVSWTWSTTRWSTDSIWNVSFAIGKADLRAGDALNLTTGRDPRHLGHIRLFEAWANAEHTAMWVFEETPPRVVHRVVAYDDRYQPIRLAGLSGAGDAKLVPGVPVPDRTPAPSTRRPTPTPTRRPTPTPTRRAAPTATPVPTRTASPTVSGTARP